MRSTDGSELPTLKAGGRILAGVLKELAGRVRPGITTAELDAIAEQKIRSMGGEPAFKGYEGFPAALCTSVNHAVVHGIPSRSVVLSEGDIIGLDLGVRFGGFYTDAALTVPVGRVDAESQRLIDVTREALRLGIDAARVGRTVGDTGAAVQRCVEAAGFGIVRQLVGHGVGRAVHEEPQVPNFGRSGEGAELTEGLVIAIEPMVTAGSAEVKTEADGWTVVSVDGSRAAHFEHTVWLSRKGPIVLTQA